MNHFANFMRKAFRLVNELRFSHSQCARNFKLSLNFKIRAARDAEGLPELARSESSLPFRNVTGH
jgi:hypothetical protein